MTEDYVEWDDYEIHMAHCDIGEYEGTCKYGEDDCPAMIRRMMKKLGYMVYPVSSHGGSQVWDWVPKHRMLASKFISEEAAWKDAHHAFKHELRRAVEIIEAYKELP